MPSSKSSRRATGRRLRLSLPPRFLKHILIVALAAQGGSALAVDRPVEAVAPDELPIEKVDVPDFTVADTPAKEAQEAQEAQEAPSVQPLAEWSNTKQVQFRNRPIRVHLLAGYAREVRFPEPVILLDADIMLPGCEIVLKDDRLELYPAGRFYRTPMTLLGTQTDSLYQLIVNASSSGQRKPIEILQ